MSKLLILLCVALFSLGNNWRNLQKMNSAVFTLHEKIDEVNFFIHYPKEKSGFARIVQKTIKEKFKNIHQYFRYLPQSDVHFVVSYADEANGMALVIPYNIVYLHDFPPHKSSYLYDVNWIENLVIHEYIHIMTMDRTEGFIDFLRNFFGSSVKVNGVLPKWVNEGVATWAESFFTTGGRLKKQMLYFEIQKILKDKNSCQDFSCLDSPTHHPFGNYPYWLGSLFLEWVENLKPYTISCLYEDHANQVPFFFAGVFERCFGKNLQFSWQEFLKEFKEKEINCQYPQEICQLPIDFEKGVVVKETEYFFTLNEGAIAGARSQATHTVGHMKNSKIQKKVFDEEIEFLDLQGDCLFVTVYNGVEERKHYCLDDQLKTKQISKIGHRIINQTPVIYQNGKFKNNKKTIDTEYKKSVNKDATSYSPHHYLTPGYLLLMGNYFGNLSSVTFMSHLVDPIERHKVFLDLDFYPTITEREPFSGGVNYFYNQKNQTTNIGYNSFLSQNIGQETININESTRLSWTKNFPDTWSKNYGAGVVKSFVNDFISSRNTSSLNLYAGIGWDNPRLTKFYQGFTTNLSGIVTETEGFNEYYGAIHNQRHFFYMNDNWNALLQFDHAQYFKTDLYRGFFNGGGINSFFTGNVPFEYYALPYGSMIGNRLSILRMKHEHNLLRAYKGWGLFPLYIKSFYGLWGLENAQTDYLLLSDAIKKDENISAYHVGLAVDTTLGYMFPARFEALYAKVVDPNEAGSMILILMKAELF